MGKPKDLLQELEAYAARGSGAKASRLIYIAEHLGWQIREGKGSHTVLRSPLGRNIPIRNGSQDVKRYCIKQILAEVKRCGGY